VNRAEWFAHVGGGIAASIPRIGAALFGRFVADIK
jgi:hypothetical protein